MMNLRTLERNLMIGQMIMQDMVVILEELSTT